MTSPLVSPRNDVWETSTEIPYWWRVTTQIWVEIIACVENVSVWFRSRERPRNGIFGFGRARKMERVPHSFTRPIFRAVFDSRSSFFAPKPHGNACYAGYRNHGSRGFHKKSVNENFFPGLYPLVGWKIGGETVYLAEGNAAGCGTAMEWARQMGKNLNLNI